MQKLSVAVSKLTKQIAKKCGKEKFLLYSLWPIFADKEVTSKTNIKHILYTESNCLLIRLACTSSSFAVKLHYKIPVITKKISLATRLKVKIELVN